MAIKKIQIRPPDNDYADVLHPETSSEQVLIDEQGTTLDEALNSHLAEDATLTEKGHVQLSTSTSSTSTALAATPSAVKAAYDKANAALPKAGGTMTGNINFNNKLAEKPEIKNYSETLVKATGVTGTKALDLSQGNVFDMTLSGATTFTFTNPPASGKAGSFTLIIRQPSTLRAVTFPSSVKWSGDEIPEFVKSKTAILTFVTVNGGSRWYGMIAGTEYTT